MTIFMDDMEAPSISKKIQIYLTRDPYQFNDTKMSLVLATLEVCMAPHYPFQFDAGRDFWGPLGFQFRYISYSNSL